jgi:Transposase DDE domain group 1
LRAIRSNWPKTEILLRADSHYCTPETIDFCRANGLDFIFGVAPTSTLRAHILALEAKATAMFEAAPKNGKVRRFKEFFDGAQSWSRVERIVARVEAGADGPDTRFVVTNLTSRNARRLYEDVYCRRGQAENHIKSWKYRKTLAAPARFCSESNPMESEMLPICQVFRTVQPGPLLISIVRNIPNLVLLHHKVCGRMCLAVEAAQHGHRGNLRTRIAISRRRTVAIEFGMCGKS